jgi:hypothetical protein
VFRATTNHCCGSMQNISQQVVLSAISSQMRLLHSRLATFPQLLIFTDCIFNGFLFLRYLRALQGPSLESWSETSAKMVLPPIGNNYRQFPTVISDRREYLTTTSMMGIQGSMSEVVWPQKEPYDRSWPYADDWKKNWSMYKQKQLHMVYA